MFKTWIFLDYALLVQVFLLRALSTLSDEIDILYDARQHLLIVFLPQNDTGNMRRNTRPEYGLRCAGIICYATVFSLISASQPDKVYSGCTGGV